MLKNSLQRKTDFLLYQILAIGFGFLALLTTLAFYIYPNILLLARSLLHKLETTCGCQKHFAFLNHPFISSFYIIAGGVIVFFLAYITFKAVRLRRSTNRFIKENLDKSKQSISPKLQKVVQVAGLKNRVIEIDRQGPVVFCFGFLKPKICISKSFVQRLSSAELLAVLLHEQQHILVREPIRLFFIKIVGSMLFFLPQVKALIKQYLTFSELAADEQATNGFSNKTPLARALYKTIQWQQQLIMRDNLALSFFQAITAERVNILTDENYEPKYRVFGFGLLILVAFLSAAFVFSVFLTNNRSVIDYSSEICLFTPTERVQQCVMTQENNYCIMDYGLDYGVESYICG